MRRLWFAGLLVTIMITSLSVGACSFEWGGSSGNNKGGQKKSGPTPVGSLEDVRDATVYIEAKGGSHDLDRDFGELEYGRGSGFIIDPEGIAVTANHVVTGAGFLEVYVEGEDEPLNATVLGASECSDLALIDIDGGDYPFLEWRDGAIEATLPVTATGFPAEDVATGELPDYTVTRGIVNTTEADGELAWASVDSVIEHDARVQGGTSGGPLVDDDGKVVGVTFAGRLDEDGDPTGQELAVSREDVQDILLELRTGEVIDSIGISGEAFTLPHAEFSGVIVNSVETGSPASEAGIEGPTGETVDIITKLEGTRLAENFTLEEYCSILRSRTGPDQPLSVEVLRVGTDESGNFTDEYSILEGEINGEPLKVVEEEAGYTTLTDETAALTMEVPADWSDVDTGCCWAVNDQELGPQISAAPDLQSYIDTWNTPGVFFAASSKLVQEYPENTVDQIINQERYDFSNQCDSGQRYNYDDGVYVGKEDVWSNCGGTGAEFHNIIARPEDKSFVVVVQIALIDDADFDAYERIIDSFEVVGEV